MASARPGLDLPRHGPSREGRHEPVRSADPVHLGFAGRAGREPQGGPRPDGRARPRSRLQDGHAVQVERGRTTEPSRSTAHAVAAGHGRRHRDRRLPADHLPDRGRSGCPDHPAVACIRRVQDGRLQPRRQARRPKPVLRRPQELHARDRQFGARRPVLRGGVRHPRRARRADRDPAHGPLLRRGGTGSRHPAGARGIPPDRRPDDDPVRPDVPR